MGCSGSKAEDLPLVVRCRERRDLIRAAANHRYALASAHVSYFRSLKDVGDALRNFVDVELVATASSSSSSFSSPSLTLPRNSKQKHGNADESPLHLHDGGDEEEEDSHLHLSDSNSSSEDGESDDYGSHHHNHHHHGHESEADARQHHKHHGGHVHKGKGLDEDDDESHLHNEERSSHYPRGDFKRYGTEFGDRVGNEGGNSSRYPRGDFKLYGNGFGDGIGNEGESSSQYPRGGSNGYGNGFVDGLGNDQYANPYPDPYPYLPQTRSYVKPYMDQWDPQPAQPWYSSNNSNMYYMKKAAPVTHTVVQEPPGEPSYGYSDMYWNPIAGYGEYVPTGMRNNEGVKMNQQKEAPPPPSPKASGWDFFNPFDGFGNSYTGYYSSGRYGYRSNSSSPDSNEVREREGIPDLEEETETDVYKEVLNGNKLEVEAKRSSGESSSHSSALSVHNNSVDSSKPVPQHRKEGSSRTVPLPKNEGKSRSVPMHKSKSNPIAVSSSSSEKSEKPSVPLQSNDNEKPSMPSQFGEKSVKPSISTPHDEGTSWVDHSGSISLSDEKSSPEIIMLDSVDEGYVKKKKVSFEVEEILKQDGDSSKLSSVTLLSPRGTRDFQEVVAEIRDEFEVAASHGKEVAVMLEVGKLPYQPSFLKVIISRILYPISPPLSFRDPPSTQSTKLASKTMKLAKAYFEDVGKDVEGKACNLSSTMDKLYTWEKKLYKEVKVSDIHYKQLRIYMDSVYATEDEEKLRIMYEKQCKRLKTLDEEGAEPGKIDAARASIRRLLTKLDVSVKAIDSISIRINKLRDEELQPQVAELIHGLIRMWKVMLKCHQKQFQAVMESKMRRLKANTSLQSDSTSRATTELERELRAWCQRFNEWIGFQKSYVESLNGWLLHCLQYEHEETPDGPVPYSPGRLGAPPIFIICNDWHQAMEAISEARVANAMNAFAASLHQLWEKQVEEGRQRLKAEYLTKDYEKHPRERKEGKTGLSVVSSDHSGVSPLDDLKVDLDSMREKLADERVKHKDAMKLVHAAAASNSLQGGLVPIFKALENFTSDALKSHEHVRLQHSGPSL
ncbi:hypothetical protein OROGR_032651 [Orobanche gracilis]